ncbi:MAG: VPDSG-CTERM sorting domain-containing protein, partial [Opitutaceae bacterium]|nr:VPDSG-CTERM sorting domain-containing protein [Opitutaceae bacterium]
LIFNIDTFTTDKLTISIPTGSATLDATGSPPGWPDIKMLFLIDPNGVNNDWIVGDPSGEGSGKIDGISIDDISFFANGLLSGDGVSILFTSTLSAGDTVTSAFSVTWSGSNVFDPSAVSSLLLTWGDDGIGGPYPFGDPQGTTSTGTVPDTGSTAALLGAGVAALAFARRRLG